MAIDTYYCGMGKGPWFGPKKFGSGYGPITWQGWALMAAFIVVVVGGGILLAVNGIK